MDGINSVTITGNLTRDPVLRHTGSGRAVANLGVAVNKSRKDPESGEWTQRPRYFDVVVWGNQAVACSEHLEKGRAVAVQGELDWEQWETEQGDKRQTVKIMADKVLFLGTPAPAKEAAKDTSEPVPAAEPELAAVGTGDEEIPF